MHAWEWLQPRSGLLLKADAVDHCDGHDLVGCQDLAWDVAGAEIELGLGADESAALRRRLRTAGHALPDASLRFHRTCYLAFQLGRERLAAQALAGSEEAPRLERAARAYRDLLERELRL